MAEKLDVLTQALAGRYRLDREIGRGGMATVYLARDIRHDRFVAFKVLRPELAASLGAERFLREITITARLDHPHILPLLDSGHSGGFLYYVMPYVEGESLRDRLARERQLPVDGALRIACEVADALGYAHGLDVIHRDIKPENILLAAGHARLVDFGIARAVIAAGEDSLTETGLAVGTPAYMSPEQAAADRALDARTDVYSLGCVLYEMLAGQPPFTGPTPAAILARHSLDHVPPLRTVRPAIPERLERTITRALAKVPADRFATAVEFADALMATSVPAPPGRSIAVLPFLNLSGDPENEYFADGITEDVIAALSKIRALKVISRTSVMPFKTRDASLREIAGQLDVATVLEGSVRRAGDRVRVVAQLIDAATDRHLWAETFDRELTDVFAIQSDVAVRIAGALQAELSPDERQKLRDHSALARAPDLQAYEAYLRGRFHFYQHTPEGLANALRYFEQALDLDADYALAHGAIADTWGARTNLGLVAPRAAYPMVRARALKAFELDETLPETNDWMGRLRFWFEWNWESAERAYQRAIELNENYPDVRMMYAVFLSAMNRHDEAASQAERAIELDPLNPFFWWGRALQSLCRRQYDDARERFLKILQLEPGFLLARLWLWSISHHARRLQDALAHATKYFEALGDHEVVGALARGWDREGYGGAMRLAANVLAERFSANYLPPTRVARLYACAGEADLALEWLEKAYTERDFELLLVNVPPTWESLHSSARFVDLVRRMQFPP